MFVRYRNIYLLVSVVILLNYKIIYLFLFYIFYELYLICKIFQGITEDMRNWIILNKGTEVIRKNSK